MIYLPYLNPVAFEFFNIKIYWYGISYSLGFICCYLAAIYLANKNIWSTSDIGDLIFYAAIGIIFGGRIGYILFYSPQILLDSPWEIFAFREPGRSFHGGFIGVLIAILIYSNKFKKHIFVVSDLAALITPIGIAFGRIGNFINSELLGKTTSLPWGMIFFNSDRLPRHPSQLYECFLEGLLLFGVLLFVYKQKPKPGIVGGSFLLCYGILRTIAELWREPDEHLGYIFANLSMGQILSLPMIIGGLIMIWVCGYYSERFKKISTQ